MLPLLRQNGELSWDRRHCYIQMQNDVERNVPTAYGVSMSVAGVTARADQGMFKRRSSNALGATHVLFYFLSLMARILSKVFTATVAVVDNVNHDNDNVMAREGIWRTSNVDTVA